MSWIVVHSKSRWRQAPQGEQSVLPGTRINASATSLWPWVKSALIALASAHKLKGNAAFSTLHPTNSVPSVVRTQAATGKCE